MPSNSYIHNPKSQYKRRHDRVQLTLQLDRTRPVTGSARQKH